MDELKRLNLKRGSIKMQLTLFSKFIQQINSETITNDIIVHVQSRLEKIESLFITFDETQTEIELLENDLEKGETEREQFQNTFFILTTKAKAIINKFNCSEPSEQSDRDVAFHTQKGHVNNVKLPRVNLPIFDGTFTQWRQFADSFKAMVHNNLELSNCQKLCYLRSSLKGEPANQLSSLETTDFNYSIAWEKLCDRYDNKRRIVNNHVNAILNLNSLHKESCTKLREFIDVLQNHMQCLKSLDQKTEHWSAIIMPIILNKLDKITVREWEEKLNFEHKKDYIPSYDELINFLNMRQLILESVESRHTTEKTDSNSKFSHKTDSNSKFSHVKTYTALTISCCHCKGNHLLYNCEAFTKMQPSERYDRVKQLNLCTNCLRKGHSTSKCKSTLCKICNKSHHTLLHFNTKNPTIQSINHPVSCEQNESRITAITNLSSKTDSKTSAGEVLLPTIIVKVKSATNQINTLRCLLDSASQSNFISERACKLLNLKLNKTKMAVTGINSCTSNLNFETFLTIESNVNNFKMTLNAYVIPHITSNIPHMEININNFEIPSNIKLADETFGKPNTIDILIGANHFWQLLCVGQVRLKNNVFLQKTRFGWIVSGQLNLPQTNTVSCLTINNLQSELSKFWQIDEFEENNKFLTPDEQYCESLFKDTTTRSPDGKFIVRLPLKSNIHDLGNSYETAKSRFLLQEKKFAKNENYKIQYFNCINDYISQKHATVITTNNNFNNESFFLPHHAVLKESSETTKLRVVFDGSCKLADGLSINQLQFVGPTIQDDLFSIITRFRTHAYVLSADITQMYRQIWIHPDDAKYQKIIWREAPNKPFEILELNTVTFGMTSAPFLAIRCLLEIANRSKEKYPLESKIIKSDFYVDDLLTGAATIPELLQIKDNVQKILSEFGFQLRKFKSNINLFKDSNCSENISLSQGNKVLGVCWNPNTDCFSFSSSELGIKTDVTKRNILATTAKLFDPIGLVAPIIIIAKLIIQEIWKLNLSWDESLPTELHTKWINLKNDLKYIEQILISRSILIKNYKTVELHGFADASERAYGACIYIKSIDLEGNVTTNLLAAKSRVAPLKNLTLPRLELLAATCLANLVSKFKNILNLNISREFYWSDSKIVLCWLKSHPSKWNTFVANRVSLIQQITNSENWYHVTSSDNPADIISRGMSPRQLITCNLWWKGPTFLNNNCSFSNIPQYIESIELPERKKCSNTFSTLITKPPITIENYSNLNKLQRVVAWIYRFFNNCKNKPKNKINSGPLNAKELWSALTKLIKISQIQSFRTEYNELICGQSLNSKSSLLMLNPFIDKDGLIRVGGRLKHSKYSYDKKYPAVLSKDHSLTKLIFRYEHDRLFHAGPNLLLSSIREKFWPITGRNLAKMTVRSCVKCFRFNPKLIHPIMGNLPLERISPTPPFYNTGVDYAGPLLIRDKLGRGSKINKCYLCLFVCFATKAIHLEPVSSLSTNAFLAAFRRFTSRRGKPLNIYSDNGTTFQGANTELQNFYNWITSQNYISEAINNEGINWHFIPPYSPHFGGIWEAGVKSTKHHLKRVLGNAAVTFEELYTILVQIEAILNSRPLTVLSCSPNDLQALTPAHFLIGRPYVAVADPNITDLPINRLDRYQYLQRINQDFWTRWSTEYISQLQHRSKWKHHSSNIEIDTIVLIKDDNSPPSHWKLGRVVTLHPGKDNVVRVVSVRCANKIMKRSVGKVFPLPLVKDKN